MRSKLARSLRKWADLIDPRVKPTPDREFTIRVSCDASAFHASVEDMTKRLNELSRLAGAKI